ncbi:shaker-related potassium channel tsha2-like isoform X2 [Haliotis rubra]|uniref:shaker-related potassium channel tsha2-like isoform X2 n=1 Tax=Haliotis rubra TaxID=36100 RepID=UPI001EE57E67|nr:shaker-related potassium channel tsha2-like isoform X2 [Haliotis rubra]
MADIITVNVSGRRFEIGRDVLSRFPDSTLGRLTSSTQKEVFFQRPAAVFKSVLGYHQTGHLHLPSSMCLGAVQIYFAVSSLMVILSVLVVFLQSMDSFKQGMTLELWKEYYGSQFQEHEDRIRVLTSSSSAEVNEILEKHNQTTKELMHNFTLPANVFLENEVFDIIGVSLTLFFLLELLLRLLTCPSIIRFFKSIMNWVDILSVAFACTDSIFHHFRRSEKFKETSMDYLGAFQIVRVLRLFRLAKHITGAKVLKYTVFTSYKEFGFIILLIFINTIVFGTLAYTVNADKMEDLPFAAWWAMVTMTTVGYGDVVPSNHEGRFVGVLCACMGIMTLALTVPLLVDNFVTFYSYASRTSDAKELTRMEKVKVSPVEVCEADDRTEHGDK